MARDGIAHRGRTKSDEMYAVVTVTTAVVIVNLLHQLEIPKESMLRRLNDLNDTLSSAARLSAKYWPKKRTKTGLSKQTGVKKASKPAPKTPDQR